MKHTAAPARRIPILSAVVTGAAVIAYLAWELLDDLADWLARSRTARTVATAVTVLTVVVALVLLTGCKPRDTRPGPIENTALEAQL